MIPKGDIYRLLRQETLGFYPDKCAPAYKDNSVFADWLSKGYFTPTTVNSSSFSFHANHPDVTSYFLKEANCLLNHAIEHLIELDSFLNSTIRSNAWDAVTIYYYAYYTVQSLFRLIGKPVIYINKDTYSTINPILNSTKHPGSGTFKLEGITNISATNSEYHFRKEKGRIHETIWRLYFNYIDDLIAKSPASAESNLYSNITNKVLHRHYNNMAWPSCLRNLINYRPGHSYKLIEHKDNLHINRFLSKLLTAKWNLMDDIDRIVSRIACDSTNIAYHIEFLYLISLCNTSLVIDLYSELILRRKIDKRHHNRSIKFIVDLSKTNNVSDYFKILKSNLLKNGH